MNTRAAHVAVALIALGGSACGAGGGDKGGVLDAGTGEEQTWDGRLITLTSSEGVRPCGGTVDFLDRFFAHNYRYWTGEEATEDIHVSLDLRSEDVIGEGGLSGHAATGNAWAAAQYAVLHETSHLVVSWQDGWSSRALTEGSAQAFGAADRSTEWQQPWEPPSAFLFDTPKQFQGVDYAPAGELFSFLLHRYGVNAVRTAYTSVSTAQTSAEVEAALVDVFGDEFYEAMDEFVTGPPCPLQAWECDGDIVPVVHLPFAIEAGASCDDPGSDVLGFAAEGDDKWFPLTMVTLELGPGDTAFEVDVTDNVGINVEPCLQSCEQEVPFYLPGEFPHAESPLATTYPEGRYFLTILPVDITKPFSVTIREAPPPRRG